MADTQANEGTNGTKPAARSASTPIEHVLIMVAMEGKVYHVRSMCRLALVCSLGEARSL